MIRGSINVLRDLDAAQRKAVTDRVAVAIVESGAFRRASNWPLAIYVEEPSRRPRVTSRGDFAQYLCANGLGEQAREVLRRRVGPREVLAWLVLEDDVMLVTLHLDRGVWSP